MSDLLNIMPLRWSVWRTILLTFRREMSINWRNKLLTWWWNQQEFFSRMEFLFMNSGTNFFNLLNVQPTKVITRFWWISGWENLFLITRKEDVYLCTSAECLVLDSLTMPVSLYGGECCRWKLDRCFLAHSAAPVFAVRNFSLCNRFYISSIPVCWTKGIRTKKCRLKTSSFIMRGGRFFTAQSLYLKENAVSVCPDIRHETGCALQFFSGFRRVLFDYSLDRASFHPDIRYLSCYQSIHLFHLEWQMIIFLKAYLFFSVNDWFDHMIPDEVLPNWQLP